MAPIDYKKVFSKLSHIKALSHDQKFDQVVQNLILYSIIQNSDAIIISENDVLENIKGIYGISIRLNIIQSNIDKLLDEGTLLRDRTDRKIYTSELIKSKINRRIDENNKLEERVKTKWLYEISLSKPEIPTDTYGKLWKCLLDYLFNVFEQHGVETLTLLNPSNSNKREDQISLVGILEKVINNNALNFNKEILVGAINQFILKADQERTAYISQLVDATFTSFALTADADTVNFLNNRFQNLLLFLDTNFIFGILDLHKNNEDSSAKEILAEIKNNGFPFSLTYHPETLAEFKRTFDSKALLLKSTKWSRETSRLALAVDGLSPIEELYHKENIDNDIDPEVFLDKYDHVDLIIKDLGLVEHKVGNTSNNEHVSIEEDIEEYKKYYEAIKNRKPKSYLGFKHDIEVLREVRSLNHKKTKFLDSKAFFISSDYILSKFERDYYKKRWEINFIVTPSTFLQLIRPFIQNDYTSNKKFIDTFSIPDIRSFEIDYTTTRSKTLQILNDNYHDTSFETKVSILRDQVLLEKFEKVLSNQQAQLDLIENKIASENLLLTQQKEEKDYEINELKDEVNQLKEILKKENEEKRYNEEYKSWEIKKSAFFERKRKEYKSDALYSVRPTLSAIIFSILVYIISRYFKEIKAFLVPQYVSWWMFVIAMIIVGAGGAVELTYRTYWCDKPRVRTGLEWLFTFNIPSRKRKMVYSEKNNSDFLEKYPEPIRF